LQHDAWIMTNNVHWNNDNQSVLHTIRVNINPPETLASTSPHVECMLIDKQRWPWPTPSFGCCSLPTTPAPPCPLYIGCLDVTQTRTRSSSSNTCRNSRLRKPDSKDPQPTYNTNRIMYNHIHLPNRYCSEYDIYKNNRLRKLKFLICKAHKVSSNAELEAPKCLI